jgi:hypothetical protein
MSEAELANAQAALEAAIRRVEKEAAIETAVHRMEQEAVRPIGAGYECRVRLPDGSPDEAILSADEAELLFGQATSLDQAEGRRSALRDQING